LEVVGNSKKTALTLPTASNSFLTLLEVNILKIRVVGSVGTVGSKN